LNLEETAFEFVEKLSDAKGAREVGQLFEKAIRAFGFNCYGMGRISAENRRVLGGEMWAQSDHPWTDHWSRRQYAKIDPVVWYWRKNPGRSVATWSQIISSHCGPRPDIVHEARDFGVRDGIAVSLGIAHGDFATVSIGTEQSEIPAPHRPALGFVSFACASRLAQINARDGDAKTSIKLSARQRECLSWAATGKSDWDISQILGLSERTVQEHIGRCIAKLGAANRTHAAIIAQLNGQISP
jgi:LuxR family quorum sensing-dependent transcriptional regulator